VEYYLKAAQPRKDAATGDEANLIRALENNAQTALQALSDGDIDHFAQEFERVIRRTVELNLPEHDKVMEQANQRNRANVRAKNFAKIKQRAKDLYDNGNWNNPRAASIALEKELSTPQRTIYRWLLKHVKNKT